MASIPKDLRYSFRIATGAPGFTAVVLLSIALGVAANATVFSVIQGVLLAPSSYKDSDRLVVLWESNNLKGIPRTAVAPATFRDWREGAHAFEDLELVAPGSPVTVTACGLPERANIQYATPRLFTLLGLRPAVGRFFVEEELKSANPVLLSYGFWQRRFAGDLNATGRRITINGELHTVVGVLPKDFHLFDRETDLWMPIDRPGADAQERSFRSWLIAVGKLRSGQTVSSAQAEMNSLARRIAEEHPDTNKNWGVTVEPIQEAQFGYWKPILFLLFAIVAFVLLISCANVAGLLLGRLTTRRRELCVRASLGAARSRIAGQLLTEGLFFGASGGLLGWLLAFWGLDLFRAVAPDGFPLVQSIRINLPVLLFCLSIASLSGAAFSITPIIFASRIDLNEALKSTSRTTVGPAHRRSRSLLVVCEVALSLVLLFAAGLMLKSLSRILRVDPGFRSKGVLTMQLFLAGPKYFEFRPEGVQIHAEVGSFYARLLERTSALPGVQSAGIVSWLPEMGYNTGRRERGFKIIGERKEEGPDNAVAAFNAASADYFKTLQIPLLRGRYFETRDDERAPWVAIVNEAFAQHYWPNNDPVGKELLLVGDTTERPRQIVGVVANVHQDSLERGADPEIFVSYLQQTPVTSAHGYQNRVHMTVVVRAAGEPAATIGAVRRIAAEMDQTQPVFGVRSMSEILLQSTSLRRLYARLLELMAGIAVFLSAMGMYAVVSHSVVQRRNEIGLRIAVGATWVDILRLVFSVGGKLAITGLAVGSLLSLILNRFLASYLFGITPSDPPTLVTSCALLVLIAAGAIWIPAWRATRVDPGVALRYD
jgi:putative ABC transport system permease protein